MKSFKSLAVLLLSAAAFTFSVGCNGGVEEPGTLEDDAAVEFGETDVDAGLEDDVELEE